MEGVVKCSAHSVLTCLYPCHERNILFCVNNSSRQKGCSVASLSPDNGNFLTSPSDLFSFSCHLAVLQLSFQCSYLATLFIFLTSVEDTYAHIATLTEKRNYCLSIKIFMFGQNIPLSQITTISLRKMHPQSLKATSYSRMRFIVQNRIRIVSIVSSNCDSIAYVHAKWTETAPKARNGSYGRALGINKTKRTL